jgi:hypothetical protein
MSELLDDATLLDELQDMLEAASGGLPSQQPSRAKTTVGVHVRETVEAPSHPLATMLLDREPAQLQPGNGASPEVEIFFTREDLSRYVLGDLQLALAIAIGDVEFSGPVRKFLRITPQLRAFAKNSEHRIAALDEPDHHDGAFQTPGYHAQGA